MMEEEAGRVRAIVRELLKTTEFPWHHSSVQWAVERCFDHLPRTSEATFGLIQRIAEEEVEYLRLQDRLVRRSRDLQEFVGSKGELLGSHEELMGEKDALDLEIEHLRQDLRDHPASR